MKQNNKVIKTSSIFLKKKGNVLFLLVPFIVIHLFLTYGIEMIIVNGESMEPAYSHGDVVFVLKIPHSYEYGDVVVAVHDNYHVLKRVAGGPEDIVNINEAENIGDVKMPHTISFVYINPGAGAGKVKKACISSSEIRTIKPRIPVNSIAYWSISNSSW